MLIKEYRIPLPLTVEEYRIAQLYMIAKKSREESKGTESGVEILVNEPYTNGPGGCGQYTHKIYHIGSHLPSWFRGLLPSRMAVEEKAWNAYPYTKTCFTCPFVARFYLEIETYYYGDGGRKENVFGLTGTELRNRIVDVIDLVRDQGVDYVREEDPRYYVSQKTGRGPIGENWIEEYSAECEGRHQPLPNGKAIMTAYKLCKLDLHFWGMQSKLENFIDSIALRKTMLRAHRQAWVWQDEWYGLTMEDIREIERQTQESLKRRMAGLHEDNEENEENHARESNAETSGTDGQYVDSRVQPENSMSVSVRGGIQSNQPQASTSSGYPRRQANNDGPGSSKTKVTETRRANALQSAGTGNLAVSNSPSSGSNKSLDLLASWRVETLMRKDSDSESDDEFFDCVDDEDAVSLAKWSSMDLVSNDAESDVVNSDAKGPDSIFSQSFLQRITTEREKSQNKMLTNRGSIETSLPGSPTIRSSSEACSTTVLCLVFHAGSALDANLDLPSKKSDVTTFKGAFESVIRQHYSSLIGRVAIKLVPCPAICTDTLAILSSLSPYSFDVFGIGDSPQMTHESVPIGAISLMSTFQSEYWEAVLKTVTTANQVYQEFLRSEEGLGFSGQIILIGDSMGAILAYDALTKHSHSLQWAADDDVPQSPAHGGNGDSARVLQAQSSVSRRRSSSSTSEHDGSKLEFEVTEFFMFGSPLGIVLANRKIYSNDKISQPARPCLQVFNLFHPTDPLAARLEPLLSARFAAISPVNVPRYNKYPLGDGQSYHILNQKWWGDKRIDYALYCPEALASFPTNSLPHLFHASYWESSDAIAFIIRQIGLPEISSATQDDKDIRIFSPAQPREKWVKKRTSVKLKNLSANHRGNDVIVKEGCPQILKARFMYGPLDMVSLSGEKVDIYVMKDPPAGEWKQLATEATDKNGRIMYTIAPGKTFGYGIYPVKMIVRGDHTSADFYCAVVPPNTECVVFSIDGSFTASVSVTGRDPRVRAGAVDVVRHWQELGYLIIYVTGRPDMQQHKVVAWLAQHNFPHGLVSFADGLSTDFLGHKTNYLRNLVQDHRLVIHAAYGSSKDIAVYSSIGVHQDKIFIVGKVSKKQNTLANVLSEGYSAHLSILMAHGGSRPAHGNSRMVIPRGYFSLPGQPMSIRRRKSAKRATSYPAVINQNEETSDATDCLRGQSPNTKKLSIVK